MHQLDYAESDKKVIARLAKFKPILYGLGWGIQLLVFYWYFSMVGW